ncbi:MAG TPA: TonB-dependent receptor [Sphingobacteriaceae bacterium]
MRKLVLSLLVLLFFAWGPALAQTRSVGGKVTAKSDGLPLPGVSVTVKGSPGVGAQTDANGAFRFNVPAGAATLVFQFIGFVRQEVPIPASGILNVELTEDQQQLSEVVVVGYGTQIRRELTGSIAKVSAKDFDDLPLNSFQSALQGRAAGVFINTGSGKLGQAMQIRVRGISSISAGNDPLYVIDGVPVVTGKLGSYTESDDPLAAISPEDIESIEVLKDAAAAAIYGSRASNGVILVTTKKGRAGRTNIDFGMQLGSSRPTNKGDFLNAAEYRELIGESMANVDYWGEYANAAEFFADWTGTDDWNQNYSTNWVDQSFQKGNVQQYSLSVNGGDAKTRFLLSGNFNDTKGIIINNNMERIAGRLSLDHTVNKSIEVGGNINLIKTDLVRVSSDNSFSNPLQLNALPPIHPLYDEEGRYNSNTYYYNGLINVSDGSNSNISFKSLTTAYASIKFTPDLTFRSEYGLDLTTLEEEEYLGRRTQDGGPSGIGYNNNVRAINFNTNNTLNWTKSLGQTSSIQLLGGFSYQKGTYRNSDITGEGFPSDRFTKIASAAKITGGTAFETAYSIMSYLARANYKLSDRYLLGATVRVDGSSRFGTENRYGTFPSVSAGWIASEEGFLKGNDVVSFLKLRGSYGLTGNAEIGNFASRTLYEGVSYGGGSGTIPSQLGDPSLTWENTATTDLAVEFGFFRDRISGIVDWYHKKTSDLLLAVPIPATNGFTTITQNIGDLENRGVEFSLTTQNLVNAFRWTTNFNISFNRNKITRLAGQPIYPGGRYVGRISVGEPYGYFYTKAYAGVDPQNGDALYYVDESRTQTTNDYSEAANQKVGDPNPDFFGGFGNRFSFKGFDLDIQTQFVYGNDIYNSGGGFMSANGDWFDNQTRSQLRRWRNPGDITDVPQARFGFGNGTNASSRYVEDGSYFRVKNVVLGYSLPKTFASKIRAQNARIYMSALNLFTWTDYTGYDPEVNTTFSGAVQLGNDFYTPPQPRTITFGLNVGF